MTTSEAVAFDAYEILGAVPAFALLDEGVRGLVAESFEVLDFQFGAAIVTEGEPADAFYVLTYGSARVVKQAANGEEVSLNTLQRGDTFGETGLLEEAGTRMATVRASSDVQVLRLHASVFAALARRHPEVRTTFENLTRFRALWNFFRIHAGFQTLPNDALAKLVAGLEPVEVPEATLVISQGDDPGPAYVVEEGRLRSFHVADGVERNLAYYRKGDVFGERSLFLGEPRAASIEALDDCSLLMLPPELFQGLVDDYPEFRERIEERVLQYDYRRLARVPLDFADEILPAEASAEERRAAEELLAPEPVTVEELGEAEAKPRPKIGRGFPHVFQLDEMDCGAACLAMVCRHYGRAVPVSHIREIAHTTTRGTTLNGITRAAEELGLEARSIRASKSRLDELPLPAIVHWQGEHWVVLYRLDKGSVRVADPESGLRKYSRERFLESWTGYASVIAYGEGLEQMPVQKVSLGWIKPFLKPYTRLLVIATVLAAFAAGLELVLPILTARIVDHVLKPGAVHQVHTLCSIHDRVR